MRFLSCFFVCIAIAFISGCPDSSDGPDTSDRVNGAGFSDAPEEEEIPPTTGKWSPSGTLYLDGHVHAFFLPSSHFYLSRSARHREVLRQGLLMESYQKLGLIPREEWLGDSFPEATSNLPTITCRLDIEFLLKRVIDAQAVQGDGVASLWHTTLQDSKDRDIKIDYASGNQVKMDPKTKKPIIPTTVRQTGRLLRRFNLPPAPPQHNFNRESQDSLALVRRQMLSALKAEAKKTPDFRPMPLKKSDVSVPDSITTLLQDMNFVSQYSAIRQLHALEQTEGQSPQVMGALARGYANLSVLTNHYWHPVNSAFAGRAIWYAESLPTDGQIVFHADTAASTGLESVEKTAEGTEAAKVAGKTEVAEDKTPSYQMTASRWRNAHRIYVYGLLGYHGETLEMIDDFEKTPAESDEPEPPALASLCQLIKAYCRYDMRTLRGDSFPKSDREFAALLSFLAMSESEGNWASAPARLSELLTVNMPDCYRLYGGDTREGLSSIQNRMKLPGATLAKNLYTQIADIPGAPEEVMQIAKKRSLGNNPLAKMLSSWSGKQPDSDFKDRQKLYRTLLGTLPQSGDSAAKDDSPLSWATLGLLVKELSFLQATYQIVAPKWAYSIPVQKEQLDFFAPLYEDHPFSEYIERASDDLSVQCAVAGRLKSRWPPTEAVEESLDLRAIPRRYRELSFSMVDYHDIVQNTVGSQASLKAAFACNSLSAEGCTLLLKNIMKKYRKRGGTKTIGLPKSPESVSPYSPAIRVIDLPAAWPDKTKIRQWEEEGYGFPTLLGRLGSMYWEENKTEDALRCFEKANEEFPQKQIVFQLADLYLAKGDRKNWQKTLEDFIKNPGPGLSYARANEKLAAGFMSRREWETALPYAQEAAISYSGWGLLCAAKCHEALRQWEEAEKYYEATAKRYRNSAACWMKFCLRTGKGNKEEAKLVMDQLAQRWKEARPDTHEFCSVCPTYYQIHDADSFVDWAKENPDRPWMHMLLFTIYHEKGNVEERDKALTRAIDKENRFPAQHKRLMPHFTELMKLFQQDLAAGGKAELDPEKVDHLFAVSHDMERSNLFYFLGCYYDACGKPDEAIRQWKRCLASRRVNSLRCTQSGAQLAMRKIPLDDLDIIAEQLAKDEARWLPIQQKYDASHNDPIASKED